MSKADRKTQVNELSGWVSNHNKPPNPALREHLMSKVDGDADLEAEAKAFLAPAKPKQVVKKKVVRKRAARKSRSKR